MNSNSSGDFRPEEFNFITLTTYRKRNVFINDTVNKVLCDAIAFHINSGHVEIAAFAIMPDHVHFILRAGDWTINEFVNNYKTYTGDKVKGIGRFSRKVWRRRFYDVPVSDLADFRKKLEKVHANPVKKKLADKPENFIWSSAANYYGWPGSAPVLVAPVNKQASDSR